MADQIRWGILGTSWIGTKVIPAIQASNNGVVAAVASRHIDRAREYAARYGIPKAYGSYEELLADPGIDAVYNPLPNEQHAPISLRCADAGKAVLCEKPLAPSAAEAKALREGFAARKIRLAEALWYRYHPVVARIKELLADGAIGELHLIRSTFTVPIQKENDIRFRYGTGGGALLDLGIYCVSVMRDFAGMEPVDVAGRAHWLFMPPRVERPDVDEWFTGSLVFPSGAQGWFGCSLRSEYECEYGLAGSKGRLLLEGGIVQQLDSDTRIRLWSGGAYREIAVNAVDPYRLMIEDFASVLLTGREPLLPPDDAVKTLEALDRLRVAALG